MAELGQGRKAQFLNMQKDGLKIRSATFKNAKAYTRKQKHKGSEY